MARYINPDSGQGWEISLAGNVVTSHADDQQILTKTAPDATRARTIFDAAIAQKRARGWILEGDPIPDRPPEKPHAIRLRNPELEAEILEDLDDDQPYRVYADWLIEQGDVHGELIAEQLSGRTGDELIAAHREELFGDLFELSEGRLSVTWRFGFIDRLRVEKLADSEDDDDRTLAEVIAAVLALPIGAFVRALSVGLGDGVEDGQCYYEPIWDVLPPAECLREIFVGDWTEWEVSWCDAGSMSRVWQLPSLEQLTVRAGQMYVGEIASSTLRQLEFITGGMEAHNLQAIAAAPAACPELRRLHVYCGSSGYGASGGVDDLMPLFDATSITDLGVKNSEFTNSVCAVIGTRPIAGVVKALDLSMGTMTSAGVASLVAARRAFRNLERLDVSRNYLTAADIDELRQLGCTVIADDQKTGDERYVSLGE
ncbi:MAG: TIGR02996 domain-containing protein [Kofleriaceae bacterium]